MYIIISTAITVLSITVFIFVFTYLCFCRACKRSSHRDPAAKGKINTSKYKQFEEKMKLHLLEYEKMPKEDISICSFDSLLLHASYIASPIEEKKLIIAFHGYRSCAAADFSPVADTLLKEGYSLILPDQRSHGKSEGKYIGFGALERFDARSWCEYAVTRFGENIKIYLYGISMGAATVTLASSLNLPKQVKGIVADCGFSSPKEIIKNTIWHQNKIPPYPTIYFMNFWSRILAKCDLFSLSSTEEVKKSKLPLLLIHGAEDRYVPTEMSKLIYQARSEGSELMLVENARHARSHIVDTQKYISAMTNFFLHLK